MVSVGQTLGRALLSRLAQGLSWGCSQAVTEAGSARSWDSVGWPVILPSSCGLRAPLHFWTSLTTWASLPLAALREVDFVVQGSRASASESKVQVALLGKHTDWSRPPWPGTIVTICMSCFRQEVLVRNTELRSHHQLEEFRKGQKETSQVRLPPRILLSGIHLGWTRHAPPGRTLSQNDWLKTTQKLIPSP